MDQSNTNIVRMIFGSHLYGTSTPTSDHDYKGIFLPSARNCYLGRIPKSLSDHRQKEAGEKNTSEDVDIEIFSLQNFIDIACKGEMVSMDMLHAPDNMLLETTPIWEKIRSERSRFYTKDMRAFVGYARKQAAKYGIRGSRLDAIEQVLAILRRYDADLIRIREIPELWLLENEHIHYTKATSATLSVPMVVVCGKMFDANCKVNYVLRSLEKQRESFGHRSEAAKNNEGIDWKAVSHAVRAALQIEEMFMHGTMTLPLKDAELIKQIKLGMMDYTRVVAPMLEGLMENVEKLSQDSSLPQSVDRQYWDDFICEVYDDRRD
jgi:hypothetical protein